MLWTLEAEQDCDDIWDYIAADNPPAAAQMDLLFSDAATKLAEFPMLEHVGNSVAPSNGLRNQRMASITKAEWQTLENGLDTAAVPTII